MSEKLFFDLFCGNGGTSVGYARAGFRVIGVDIVEQPNYPYEFIQGDAIKFAKACGYRAAAIGASPPCFLYTALTQGTNGDRGYPDLIGPTRRALQAVGKPWVMENVPGAPLRHDLTLCGTEFGLKVFRHRHFEIEGWSVPEHVTCNGRHAGRVAGWRHGEYYEGEYFAVYGNGGGKGSVADWQRAMGIDWTDDRAGIARAVPPAYTEWIGRHLMKALES